MVKIKPLTLEVEENVWKKFKELTPRTITLNDAVIDLILKKIKKEKQK